MTQPIQFSGALLHQPDLIILDEPFAGLDPLNVELMKEIIREEQAKYQGCHPDQSERCSAIIGGTFR